MPAHDDPPVIGPVVAVFVCGPCGVRVELDDPAHVRVCEALHAAAGCGDDSPWGSANLTSCGDPNCGCAVWQREG